MAKQCEPITIVTAEGDEKYEYKWIVRDFRECTKDKALLKDHEFEIETDANSLLHSKWAFGIENSGASYFKVNCSLMEILKPDETSLIRCKLSAELRNSDESNDRVIHKKAIDWSKGLQGAIEFIYPTMEFLGASGSAVIYLTLRLFKPTDGANLGVLETKMRTESIAAAKAKVAEVVANSTVFDTKIVSCEGQQFECHKAILEGSSPVLKSMMESGLSESKTGLIKVTDISGPTMEILVHYMYTGQLQDSWKDAEVILELTYAAGKYQMTSLLEYLDNFLGHVKCEGFVLCGLVDLTSKLSLKKAEAMLISKIAKLTVSAENTKEISAIFGDKPVAAKNECKIFDLADL